MCDRFSLTADLADITRYFRIDKVPVPYRCRYNIAPTQMIHAVLQRKDSRNLELFRWGLFPFWAKDAVSTDRDAVYEKGIFRRLLAKKRCIVPCSGFYLWRGSGKLQQAFRVVPVQTRLFGMAGVYDIWQDPRGNETLTFTLITASANFADDQRIPVMLEEAAMDAWLDPLQTDKDHLISLLRPCSPANMRTYPVTPRVADILLESPECIRELDPRLPLAKV